MSDLLFQERHTYQGAVGEIGLQRSSGFNALTVAMVESMQEKLTQWAADPAIKAVILHSHCDQAFCAGGDIKYIYHNRHHIEKSLNFFQQEYALCQHFYHFPKPCVALCHGITMGGGVGISMYGSHLVVTDDCVFAMPETAIGFYPDIGAAYFLNKLPTPVGRFLGLTGASLDPGSLATLKLADVVIPRQQKSLLIDAICDQNLHDNAYLAIDTVLKSFSVTSPPTALQHYQPVINDCFGHNTIEEIMQSLEQSPHSASKQVLDELKKQSPTSLKVTDACLTKATGLGFDAIMTFNLTVTHHFLKMNDFYEGIRAMLIDKDRQPQWQPTQLPDVTAAMIQAYFD